MRISGERGAAEEITQDVFLQFWRCAAQFDPTRGDLAAWLLAIARNRSIDRLRSRYQRAGEACVPLDEPVAAPDRIELSFEAADRVRGALAALPQSQRQVIELAYYEGYSQSEIAAHLSQPLGTVKTWTRSGLRILREALQQP